jgi:hypothetical protein
MKKLVLGVLLASAASAAGCVENPTVTATWDFTHLANNSARSCPDGFGTVRVIAQPTDPTSHLGAGNTFIDKFNCADGRGRLKLTDDIYLVWIEVTNNSETSTYATSQAFYYDTVEGNVTLPFEILDDGGYFSFTWDLVDARTNAPLSCRDAGVGSSGSIEAISTSMANPSAIVTDKFDCEDHYGTSDPLLEGDYTFAIHAERDNLALGEELTLTKQIKRPNVVTFIGDLLLPID